MLQKQPFEPLSKASLKHITFKLIFLMAISTFRRCSDLQSLTIGEAQFVYRKGESLLFAMVWQNKTEKVILDLKYLFLLLTRIIV